MGFLQKIGIGRKKDNDDSFPDDFDMGNEDHLGFNNGQNTDPFRNETNYSNGLDDNRPGSNAFGMPQGINTKDSFNPNQGFTERPIQNQNYNGYNNSNNNQNQQSMEVLNKNIEILSAKIDLIKNQLESMNSRLKNMESYELQQHSPIHEKVTQNIQKRYNQW